MNVDIIPLLATIIVVATIVTIIFAIASYIVFRLRERRHAQPAQGVVHGRLVGDPQFFRPYTEN